MPYSTCWVKPPLLALKLLSPLYRAVMGCEPRASEDVLKLAWPEASVGVPRVVDPSRKVTVPVAMPPADELTVAVKVTGCPSTEGFGEEVTTTVVAGNWR